MTLAGETRLPHVGSIFAIRILAQNLWKQFITFPRVIIFFVAEDIANFEYTMQLFLLIINSFIQLLCSENKMTDRNCKYFWTSFMK